MSFFLMAGWYSAGGMSSSSCISSSRIESDSIQVFKVQSALFYISLMAARYASSILSWHDLRWTSSVSACATSFSMALRRTRSIVTTRSWRRRAYADLWITFSKTSLVVASSIQRIRETDGSVGKRTS